MTLDEAIARAKDVAEENQRVIDTEIVFNDVTIDMLYCDDTEVIEEHLANYQKRAEEYRQLAEWLKDYKRLKEREPCEDCISRAYIEPVIEELENICYNAPQEVLELLAKIKNAPPVTPQPKIGRWIMKHRSHNEIKHYTGQDEMGETHTISVLERYEADEPYCSECGKRAGDTSQDYCCACGAKMVEPQAESES